MALCDGFRLFTVLVLSVPRSACGTRYEHGMMCTGSDLTRGCNRHERLQLKYAVHSRNWHMPCIHVSHILGVVSCDACSLLVLPGGDGRRAYTR